MRKYFDSVINRTGDAVVGASVYVADASTGAAAAIYSDDGVTRAQNPITCDRNGAFAFYAADGRYTLTVSGRGISTRTVPDVLLEDASTHASSAAAAAATAEAAAALVGPLTGSGGAAVLGFMPAGTGAVARTAQDKLREVVSVKDFGAVGDGVADDTLAIRAALNSGAFNVSLPSGQYRVTPQADGAALQVPDGVNLRGDPSSSELYMVTDAANDPNTSVSWDVVLFTGARTRWSSIDGIRIRHSGGTRNNACSIAVRAGASMVSITRNDIDGSIANAIGVEGSVASPIKTSCLVMGNKLANTTRHGVYLSGATHNVVRLNHLTTTRLESIVNRNGSDNDIDDNAIDGDGVSYPPHAIAMAQPASGVYVIERIRIRGNRAHNIPGAGFYGQGLGVTIADSEISGNVFNAMQAGTSHAMMLYRVSRSRIKDNTVHGGRNRGLMFYGCQNNDVTGNTVRNVNSQNSTIGAMVFSDYTDPADASRTYSTGNLVERNKIVDDRGTPLHVYGIQFLAGSNANRLGENLISGLTSSKYVAGDSWSTFSLPTGDERQWFHNDIAGGTTTSTQIPVIGDTYSDVVTETGWLKALVLVARQTITSGTITATLYKNGSVFRTVTLTGDGATTVASVFDQPGLYPVAVGDRLTVFFSASSVVTGTIVDILVRAKFAAA
jgi:parallel beta-helix repeat protein